MTREALIAALEALVDPTVAHYQNTVISDTRYPMRNIRIPRLRELAKIAAKEDWQELVRQGRYETFEEVMVIGLAVAYAKGDLVQKLPFLRQVFSRLDSWALTDSIVPTLKWRPEERDTAWNFAMECLQSPMEYTVRCGVLLLKTRFLTAQDIPRTAAVLSGVQDGRYYVQMAVAWSFADMAVVNFETVENILKSGVLDTFTQNMTIRKMRESFRISPEEKAAAAAWKRKEEKR